MVGVRHRLRMVKRCPNLLLVLALAVLSCSRGALPSTALLEAEPCPGQRPRVPDLPPEGTPASVAAEIYAPENLLLESPHMRRPFPRDVLLIWFQYGATQRQRQAALDTICGEVIGGERFGQGGYYHVRIRGDDTGDRLFRAINLLRRLPQVAEATVDVNLLLSPVNSQLQL
jgi:hypothetical protein